MKTSQSTRALGDNDEPSTVPPLVRATGLSKEFELPGKGLFGSKRTLQAVTDVDLEIHAGETVSLVGESGSGKSTIGRLLLGLIDPTDGEVLFQGQRIGTHERLEGRALRRKMQMIFQSPYSSLNPRKSVRAVLRQPFLVHDVCEKKEIDDRVGLLLESVGLTPASQFMSRFPHELSGGQRQRVGVARAVALEPDFIVADEPLSALDMSVQAQLLRLLNRLRSELGLAFLMITHDLVIARSMSDRVLVLYLGRVVEEGTAEDIFGRTLHPYTMSLLAATPIPDPVRARTREKIRLRGEMPSPTNPPSGCAFHTRCPYVRPTRCVDERPILRTAEDGHAAACHYMEEIRRGEFQPYAFKPVSDGSGSSIVESSD